MNKEDIIRMADAVENKTTWWHGRLEHLERFAALVEAHVNAKEKERQRYDLHSCGPTCDRYICVAVRNEREACAKVCEVHGSMARHSVWMAEECAKLCDYLWESKASEAYECATAIRKRVNYE